MNSHLIWNSALASGNAPAKRRANGSPPENSTIARARLTAVSFGVLIVFGVVSLRAATLSGEELAFFERSVRPLLVEHCYECHSATSRGLKGGLRLDHRAGVRQGGDSGPAIVPGRPDQSRLISAISYRNRDLQMPPRRALAPDDVRILTQWVAMGAPDPREEVPPLAARPMGMSLEEGRQFWSFRPVGDPRPPDLARSGTNQMNPVDAFVQARLRERGLEQAPRADKRTLIRRVTYDLIGLPPTAAEVEAFAADDSPAAFGKVVDRLLESPQYGVRWGRHWLDVARYADSNGLDENLAFGHAWRYRDYVVDSFNRDKPFDRFLIEQIAGDLVAGANEETLTATGFLALGAKVLAEKDREKLAMDVIDEQIDTLGKTFLGLTLGCARCHDHKFDPLTQADYFGLAAIFKGTRTFAEDARGSIHYWYEHALGSKADRERIKGVEQELAARRKAASDLKTKVTIKLRGEARSRATDYLLAATRFPAGAGLDEVARVAGPMRLHPRILHHCRLHLDYHREDKFFADWHRLRADTNALVAHFGTAFREAEEAFAAARKRDAKVRQLDDERLERARAALYDLSGFLAVPSQAAHAFDPATLAEYERLEEEARLFESRAPDFPAAMGVADGKIVEAMPLHIRGNHLNPGPPVRREFPEVLRLSAARPILPRNSSGRLQLAGWMADSRNPLTARVLVNRVWRWHFGRGLVRTTENFGALGDPPSHPELLDWLARRFMESGWRLKELHRLLLSSRTYQMAGRHPEAARAELLDPENRLWWRFDLRRLEAEQLRDSILHVAGLLDLTPGGKTIPLRNRQFCFNHTSRDHTSYDAHRRRALYLPVVRNHLCDLFQQFDYPDPATPTGDRQATVIAPQALFLMNSPLVMDAADTLAASLLETGANDRDRVRAAYQRILQRPPSAAEEARACEFIRPARDGSPRTGEGEREEPADRADPLRAWSMLCQSLLAANEFMYLR